jgi:RNA polymerase sigma-70 factor (ECF subfamily)
LISTQTLLLRVHAGDSAAQQELFERFLPGLRRWASGRLPARARGMVDTDDLVQISLVRAFGRIEEFQPRGRGAFLAYLRQILLNCVREEIRRSTRRPGGEPISEDLAGDRPSPTDQLVSQDTLDSYQAGLSQLSEEQQMAVILRVEFGFSHQEIASALGRPTPDAARMLVARSLARLAEVMIERP